MLWLLVVPVVAAFFFAVATVISIIGLQAVARAAVASCFCCCFYIITWLFVGFPAPAAGALRTPREATMTARRLTVAAEKPALPWNSVCVHSESSFRYGAGRRQLRSETKRAKASQAQTRVWTLLLKTPPHSHRLLLFVLLLAPACCAICRPREPFTRKRSFFWTTEHRTRRLTPHGTVHGLPLEGMYF